MFSTSVLKTYKLNDIVFAFGIVLTIITNMRFPSLPIGLGEIVLLIWIMDFWVRKVNLNKIKINKNAKPILRFWLIFLFLQVIGMFVSSISGRLIIINTLHDILAYLFSAILCLTMSFEINFGTVKNKVKYIVLIGIPLFLALSFWWKFVGNTFFGIGLVFGGIRYTGGAINPNQLALYIVTMPFLSLYFLREAEKSKKRKILWLFMFISSIYLGMIILSDALNATWIIVSSLVIAVMFLNKTPYTFKLFILLLISIVFLVFILYNNDLLFNTINFFESWFNNLDNNNSRAELWLLGVKTGISSFLLGYGPGAQVIGHITEMRMEVHNTYIDIFTQIGIIGLLAFLILIKNIYSSTRKNILITLSFLSLVIFILGHFSLRQPIFWVLIIFFANAKSLLSEKLSKGIKYD